tara:strand:+ start:764 stop:1369 length:606 start_codon:yes stop_codon:yes gene_type:complete
MKKIFFFSNNKNKLNEISDMFYKTDFKILSLNSFSNLKIPKETGITFEENAKIKSLYGLKKTNIPCFADDSGFCIKSLKNFPGIKSKRFIEENNGVENTLKVIMDKTKNLQNKEAYFKTSISFSFNDSTSIFNGLVMGKISEKPRGNGGFGYDPIFIPNGYNKTFAEMELEQKNKISHRFIAINKFKKYLIKLLKQNSFAI